MKDQHLKKISSWLAFASLFAAAKMSAASFNDVQFWTGTGTNRAALVIEWQSPEDLSSTSVPAPIADKSLVWGYRFNGTATGTQMFEAIVAGDPRLYVVETIYSIGTSVSAIGYHLNGGGDLGISDGSATNYFSTHLLTNATVYLDAAAPVNPGDLYWGDLWGPSWELWTEQGDAGGFLNCPDRGANAYWTSTDPDYASSGFHGQWDLAQRGLSGLILTNGSWIGFSIAAATYNPDLSAPYNAHKHAPKLPDPAITALVKNLAGSHDQSGAWKCEFTGVAGWNYTLQRSTNLVNWGDVITGQGVSGTCDLYDQNLPDSHAFYRVRAEQP